MKFGNVKKSVMLTAASLLALSACSNERSAPLEISKAEIAASEVDVAPYKAELDLLLSRIKAEHPRPFRFAPEAELNALVTDLKANIRPDYAQRDTLWAFSRILTRLGCGHTRQFYFVQEDQLISPQQRFPVDVRYVEGQLYVFDPLANASILSKGSIITSINGRAISDIIADVYDHIPADMNEPYLKRHMFNVSATSYLTYAMDFPDKYEVAVEGEAAPIALEPLNTFTHAPIVSPSATCQDKLCYSVDSGSDTGVMTIRTFAYYGEQGAEFAAFVDNTFEDVSDNNRKNLVIDVRDNDGGSGLAVAYLLRRLASEPFKYWASTTDPRGSDSLKELQQPVETGFDGQVYILMNGNTVSAAPHFFSLAKANNMAILVGESAGGNHSTTDGKITFTSETSKIDYWIARMRFDSEVGSVDYDKVLEPDIAIPYTVEETLSREDEMMTSLLNLIEQRNE